jgi:TonB family protein
MSRVQKKCFIASTGVHLLLVVILFVGSAFFSPPKKGEDLQELDFVPTRLVDAMVSGGGERVRGTPQPPTPPPSSHATPTPERAKEPDPPKEPVKQQKQPKSDVESFEVTKKQPKLSPDALKMVTRNSSKTHKKTNPSTTASDARDEQLAKLSQEIARTARGLKDGTATPTQIVDIGPGGGGPSYANYKSWIYTVYLNAWVAPDDAAQDSGVVEAEVTILRDGTVQSSQISSKSGDSQMDASVQRTLKRVTTIGKPFPEGVKENQRTYTLRFDIKTKRGFE